MILYTSAFVIAKESLYTVMMRPVPAWLVSGSTNFFPRPVMEVPEYTNMTTGRGSRGGRGRNRGRGRGHFGLGRGRGRGGGQGSRGRARYQGTGVPFTPVAKGFKYFKHSFLEDPWKKLEELQDREEEKANMEEIDIDIDLNNDMEETSKPVKQERGKELPTKEAATTNIPT